MRITVTVPDHFAASVKAQGLTPEGYIEALIAGQAGTVPVGSDQTVTRLADLELLFQELAVHSSKVPILPDKALTRDSFYLDHD